MRLAAAVYALIVLHRVDGGEVFINPAQVVSLRIVEGPFRARIGGGRCVIDMTDRKFVAVLESCAEVAKLLRETQR